MAKEKRNDTKSSTHTKVWSLGHDKKYFVELWEAIKENRKQSLVIFVGLTYLLTLTLLYLEVEVVGVKVWGISVVLVVVIMAILLSPRRVRKKAEVDKVVRHDFNPVSLGTLWFSFALTLWISQQTTGWILYIILIEIFLALGTLAFLVAVLSRSVRKFINTRAAAFVIPTTLLAFFFGFALGWLPALSQVSGVVREVIIYFGFLWVIAMLAILFRDVKNKLARMLFVAFFVCAAIIKFFAHDTVGIISGITLIFIAALLYLVATDRAHPYGEVSEQ